MLFMTALIASVRASKDWRESLGYSDFRDREATTSERDRP
jgi:hypothetical protein